MSDRNGFDVGDLIYSVKYATLGYYGGYVHDGYMDFVHFEHYKQHFLLNQRRRVGMPTASFRKITEKELALMVEIFLCKENKTKKSERYTQTYKIGKRPIRKKNEDNDC